MPQEAAAISRLREILNSKVTKILCFAGALIAALAFGSLICRAIADYASYRRGENALDAGLTLSDGKNFAAAIPKLNAALREKLTAEQRASALGERGWCYTRLDRDPDALRDFDAALAIDPSLVFALLDRGLAYHRQGHFDEAMADYTKTISLDPNKGDAYRNRALIFAQRGQLAKAIADMSEAIRCAPDNPELYDIRGNLYFAKGEPSAALASFESAIRLDPENIDGQYGRAQVLTRNGESTRVLAELSEWIRKRPASARLFYVRALIHGDAEELDRAVDDCAEAIRLQKNFAPAYSTRSLIELKLGDFEAALAFARLATELDPRMAQPFFVRGRVFDSRMEFGEAVREFDRAVALETRFVAARGWGALAKAHAGAYAVARREFEEITANFPIAPEGHGMRAWFLATCPEAVYRNGAQAVAEAKLSVEYSHEDPNALESLAVAFTEEGDFARAIDLEETAADKTPSNAADCRRFDDRLAEFRRGMPHRDAPGL